MIDRPIIIGPIISNKIKVIAPKKNTPIFKITFQISLSKCGSRNYKVNWKIKNNCSDCAWAKVTTIETKEDMENGINNLGCH